MFSGSQGIVQSAKGRCECEEGAGEARGEARAMRASVAECMYIASGIDSLRQTAEEGSLLLPQALP